MKQGGIAIAILVWLATAGGAWAVTPDEILDDPALEARARDISAGLRCMVCQNQSIDDSDADLAKDLRVLVRERLEAGDSDEEVVSFVVSRYGDFVLLKPRLTGETVLLWFAPALLLAAGLGFVAVSAMRRRAASASEPLTDEEKRAVEQVLSRRDESM